MLLAKEKKEIEYPGNEEIAGMSDERLSELGELSHAQLKAQGMTKSSIWIEIRGRAASKDKRTIQQQIQDAPESHWH